MEELRRFFTRTHACVLLEIRMSSESVSCVFVCVHGWVSVGVCMYVIRQLSLVMIITILAGVGNRSYNPPMRQVGKSNHCFREGH